MRRFYRCETCNDGNGKPVLHQVIMMCRPGEYKPVPHVPCPFSVAPLDVWRFVDETPPAGTRSQEIPRDQ